MCRPGCAEGFYNATNGCDQCKHGYQHVPECCECAKGFEKNEYDNCVESKRSRVALANSASLLFAVSSGRLHFTNLRGDIYSTTKFHCIADFFHGEHNSLFPGLKLHEVLEVNLLIV